MNFRTAFRRCGLTGLLALALLLPQGCGRSEGQSAQASPVPSADTTSTTVASKPTPIILPASGEPYTLTFPELYSSATITGPVLSPLALALNDRTVTMVGYMAPPLKPDLDFFVLTKTPMVNCPFCSSATDWPFDIVFVRMANGNTAPTVPTQRILVSGRFSVGTDTDKPTGFVSMVRIYADDVEVLQ